MTAKSVLAIDLGASAGRVVAVHWDGSSLDFRELHRFDNQPQRSASGTLQWDIDGLWGEIRAGIKLGQAHAPVSLGVDTWGVDFGLLDSDGKLLSPPVHYRDERTQGMMEKVFSIAGRRRVFQTTGIQLMPINSLYQMMSLVESQSPDLKQAATFLTMPDLFNYWLTGVKAVEYSNASTTQMVDIHSGQWARELLAELGMPTDIFPELVPSGTRLGDYEGMAVIAPACHDTGSAVAAVPAEDEDFCYISSGTWSLVGVEEPKPLVNRQSFEANFTNEGGAYGTTRLLKNVMGLWIVQQCRQTWLEQGQEYSFEDLMELARQAQPLRSLVDPDDERFLPPGDHPELVRRYCAEHDQPIPENPGQVIRCVLESLALKYRQIVRTLEDLTGRSIHTIHVVGGGSRNELLCQMTADSTGCTVIPGPVEATVLGNALVQMTTLGEFNDIWEARRAVAAMSDRPPYMPEETASWDEAYEAMAAVYAL